MKLKFKKQAYQTCAVESVVDRFRGQPNTAGSSYRIDPGYTNKPAFLEEFGFKNGDIVLYEQQVLENIQEVQRRQNLPQSGNSIKTKVSSLNIDRDNRRIYEELDDFQSRRPQFFLSTALSMKKWP